MNTSIFSHKSTVAKITGVTLILALLLGLALMGGFARTSLAAPSQNDLISIDFDPDSVPDGVATGQLGSLGITLTSTDGTSNGGSHIPTANWNTQLGTNDVPGVNDPNFLYQASAIDWLANTPGFATFTFTNGEVKDPILFFSFTDHFVEAFDFDDSITINVLDSWSTGSNATNVIVDPGNVVRTDGTNLNTADDGFAIQLIGTFSVITFVTNTDSNAGDSLAFTIGAQSTDLQSDPSDFGDAPDTNGQTSRTNAAFHIINASSPYLGAIAPDAEDNGIPSANADGDDNQDQNDEDGLTGFLGVDPNWSDGGAIEVDVSNVSTTSCVYAWVDWAGDGFGVGNDSTSEVTVNTDGTVTMTFPADANMPAAGSFPASAYLRLRVVEGAEGACGPLVGPTGGTTGGEVEDHVLHFQPTAVTLQSINATATTPANWLVAALLAGFATLVGVYVLHKRSL